MNNKDPLAHTNGRELFEKLAAACNGRSSEEVVNAAANLIINMLRQTHATRLRAELAFDEYFAKSKEVLMSHYDSFGRKKGVFPYHQHIVMPYVDPSREG